MGCESQPPDIYRYNDEPEQRPRTSRIPCAAPQAEGRLESGFQSSRTPTRAFPRVDPKVVRERLRHRPRAQRALRGGRRHLLLSSSCATSSGPVPRSRCLILVNFARFSDETEQELTCYVSDAGPEPQDGSGIQPCRMANLVRLRYSAQNDPHAQASMVAAQDQEMGLLELL